MGPIYDAAVLHALKQHCHLYFHGHSVGGTNPSLLEAMASGALVAAHDNCFNRGVTGENALYFGDSAAVTALLEHPVEAACRSKMIAANYSRIEQEYNWPAIISRYEQFFSQCYLETRR